jgi:hypothetical protein
LLCSEIREHGDFFQETYSNDPWTTQNPGPSFGPSKLPFGTMQFSVEEVEKILLEIDTSKVSGPDVVQ